MSKPRAISAERDFGGLLRGTHDEVLRPAGADDVTAAVRLAARRRVPVTPRGLGRSQGGQSVAEHGIALDLSGLGAVIAVDPSSRTVTCEGGALWRSVVERTTERGLLPSVVPHNLDLTVGGTISVGGIGTTSHRHGCAAANVVALEVVTGTGKRIRCSREEQPALFEAVLGGLGLFGIIVRVTLKLRPIAPRVRCRYLLYDDRERWLEDQRALSKSGACAHLEAFLTASVQGLRGPPGQRKPFAHWFYGLHAGVEHSGEGADAVFGGLSPYRVTHEEDLEIAAFLDRYQPRFSFMERSGAWEQAHPWLECFMPVSGIDDWLPQVLDDLPLFLGDGHRFLLTNAEDGPGFLMMPRSDEVACFAVVPAGVPPPLLDEALAAIRRAHRTLVAAGGKRYLSGWLGMMDVDDWRDHFGDRHSAWREARARFDPDGLFASALRPGEPRS